MSYNTEREVKKNAAEKGAPNGTLNEEEGAPNGTLKEEEDKENIANGATEKSPDVLHSFLRCVSLSPRLLCPRERYTCSFSAWWCS